MTYSGKKVEKRVQYLNNLRTSSISSRNRIHLQGRMAQLKVVYEGKGANLVGKAWRYGAMGGTWEEGAAEGQVIVSLQVQDRNYQPLMSSLKDDPNVIDILDGPPKPAESS